MRKSKNCRMTKGGNTCPTSSSNSLIAAEFIDATRLATGHSRNRVAECANRTMGDDISAMLYEAQLPPSLWGEALATQIHIWNRLPTSSLKGMTPYEAWFKQKPDVSHLRVWGCLAYVFIQKDKRRSLQPHMEKCVFMGYPSGYKGWKFYNPTTQKYLISERAEFDERIFPGLAKNKATSPTDLMPPGSPSLAPVPTSVPMLDLEGDSDVEVIAPRIPHVELPLDAALPECTPTPPASPAIVHAPLPALAHDLPPDLRRTSHISHPPGEWWKVRLSAEPEAEPPAIWFEVD